MQMLKRTGTLLVVAALGGGASIGVAACGEDRGGEVKFEGDAGTDTGTGTTGTGTTGTETSRTETNPSY
ncbi:MAG TPA: hypothetical protein VGO83_15345 [Thermoleophilaceae bacterium]|jgi:hypothetical protein|nr:hypothetical protein [Thermoleophilaceae bacterium]